MFVRRRCYVLESPQLEAAAVSPFEVLSVTDDRDSYRLTTRAWAQNLEAARSSSVTRWGERQFRRFQLYLWGCVHGFETHQLGAYHLLLRKGDDQWTRDLRRPGWVWLPFCLSRQTSGQT